MKNVLVLILSGFLTLGSAQTWAQCVNPAKPNCDFYGKCLEKYCPCGWSSSGYALTYGQKYCTRFLAAANFSEAGRKWRDATLVCLQEKLVPIVPIDKPGSCDCSKVRDLAYSIHAACYSQPNASICDSSSDDLAIIDGIVDDSDKLDRDGLKALGVVLSTCLSSNPSFPVKAILAKIKNLIN